jgi:predicted metal-dependent phosphotriesterase family hydrolase
VPERIVRTVRGDIAPGELGACDAHEHLFLVTPLQPGDEYADVNKSTEEAESLRAAGADALVDWTPIGLGRDLAALRSISEKTGLHVVAATGLHCEAHYSADMFDSMDSGRAPTETFYDGYVVNAVMDACYRSAASRAWEPVALSDWRGGGVEPIAKARRMHDGKVVVKEEKMPDGRLKLILKDERTGEFADVVA